MRRRQLTALLLLIPSLAATALASDAMHDPTRPYSEQPRSASPAVNFEVSAIFISSERRVAVLNGKRVVAGDVVDGAMVTAIGDGRLHLDYKGKIITVPLHRGGSQDKGL